MCKTKTGCSFIISSLRGRGGVWKKIVTGKSSPKAVLDVGCPWGRGIQRLSPSPWFGTCLKNYPSFIAHCGVGSGFSEAALQSNFSLCPALLPSTLYRGYAQKHISIISIQFSLFPRKPNLQTMNKKNQWNKSGLTFLHLESLWEAWRDVTSAWKFKLSILILVFLVLLFLMVETYTLARAIPEYRLGLPHRYPKAEGAFAWNMWEQIIFSLLFCSKGSVAPKSLMLAGGIESSLELYLSIYT